MILTGETKVFHAEVSKAECKKLEAVITQPKVYVYEKQDLSVFVTKDELNILVEETIEPVIADIIVGLQNLEPRVKANEDAIKVLIADKTVIGSVDNKIDEALRTEELSTK